MVAIYDIESDDERGDGKGSVDFCENPSWVLSRN